MRRLAEAIESYIDEFESVMIVPDELMKECSKNFEEGLKRSKKLIKKLKKGDTEVFKDEDEWNFIG